MVVVNPFEPFLSYAEDRLAVRRDNPKYLHLILAVTFLHQLQRPVKRDEAVGEYIETTLADVAAGVIADVAINASLDQAPAEGDPRLAESLVANLVGNAVRHNVPGGWASIETSAVGGRAVLRVSNSGPVIPPAEVDRLFQPFQRFGPRPARACGRPGRSS